MSGQGPTLTITAQDVAVFKPLYIQFVSKTITLPEIAKALGNNKEACTKFNAYKQKMDLELLKAQQAKLQAKLEVEEQKAGVLHQRKVEIDKNLQASRDAHSAAVASSLVDVKLK